MTTYDFGDGSIAAKATLPALGVLYGADDAGTTSPAPYTQAGIAASVFARISGDATLNASGAITITKTSGTAFGSLATLTPGTGVATALGNNAGAAGGFATYSSLGSLAFASSVAGSALTGTSLAAGIVSSSLTSVGTIGTGAWQGTAVGPAYGGTGVANNAANTITFSGNYGLTLTLTGTASVGLGAGGTVLYTDKTGQTITGGAGVTPYAYTVSGNAITLDCTQRPQAYVAVSTACQINAPSADGSQILDIEISTGGSVTWSGFQIAPDGDAVGTTNGTYFRAYVTRNRGRSMCTVKKQQ